MAWNIVYSSGIVAPAQNYGGYTPTLYAAPTAQGSGDGSNEANAMDFETAIGLIGNGSTGNCLGVIEGVCSGTPSLVRWDPIFKVVNSGTVNDPIVVVAKHLAVYNMDTPANLTELRSNDPQPVASGNNSAVLGTAPGVDYVYFVGFYANQVYAPPRPSNGTFLISYGCVGVQYQYCWLEQTVNPTGDNYDSFYLEGDTDSVISNCYISGGSGAGNHNASAITTYGSTNFLFEHVQGTGLNQFIFVKGSNGATFNSGTIRYCYAQDCSQSFLDAAVIDPVGVDVYQNLGVRCWRGVVIDNSAAASSGYIRDYNNTFVDMTGPGWNAESGVVLTGCTHERTIVAYMSSTSVYQVQLDGTLTLASAGTFADNLYYEAGASAQFYQNGTPSTGLSAWQTATGKEAGSAETNPNFTDASADNYHRSSYADGRGCYITGTEEIGLQAQ